LERIFFEIGCDVARTLMEQYLLKADEILEKTRDKASLRHKGSRTTSIKTLMGEVQMNRTLYRRVNEAGATEHIFFLRVLDGQFLMCYSDYGKSKFLSYPIIECCCLLIMLLYNRKQELNLQPVK
jgi:hypothetical protein